METVFILNGKIRKRAALQAEIKYMFPESKVLVTSYPRHAIEITKEVLEYQPKYLISVGGDGTLNEVINGYLDSPEDFEDKPVVGVLPNGSANDFVTATNAPLELREVKKRMEKNKILIVDAGLAVTKETSRYFINVADIGFGAIVVRKMRNGKFLNPSLSYLWAITRTFVTYKPIHISCQSPDFTWEGKCTGVFVANGKCLGSGIYVAPDGKVNDGLLEVLIIGNVNMIDYALNISKLKKKQKISHPEFHYFTTSQIKIKAFETCYIESDGELIGSIPVECSILPKAVKFLS